MLYTRLQCRKTVLLYYNQNTYLLFIFTILFTIFKLLYCNSYSSIYIGQIRVLLGYCKGFISVRGSPLARALPQIEWNIWAFGSQHLIQKKPSFCFICRICVRSHIGRWAALAKRMGQSWCWRIRWTALCLSPSHEVLTMFWTERHKIKVKKSSL